MIPLSLPIGLTIVGGICYLCFMVDNSKAKPRHKRKPKPETPEPVKQEEHKPKEEPKLKMEDYPIA
jgi:hypothetical protein